MIDLLNPAWFIGWETIDHVTLAKRELNKSGKIFMYEEKKGIMKKGNKKETQSLVVINGKILIIFRFILFVCN